MNRRRSGVIRPAGLDTACRGFPAGGPKVTVGTGCSHIGGTNVNYLDAPINLPDGTTKRFGALTQAELRACGNYVLESAALAEGLGRLHQEAVALINESGLSTLGEVSRAGGERGRRARLLLVQIPAKEFALQRRIDITLPEIPRS
jgi:hypothetical protein